MRMLLAGPEGERELQAKACRQPAAAGTASLPDPPGT